MSVIVPATVLTPTEYAQELLELCNTACAATDAGSIDRRYTDSGRPMLLPDCDQLVVSGFGLGESPTIGGPSSSGIRHIHGRVNLIGFLVTVALACAPTFDDSGNPPSPAAISSAGSEIMQAAWSIWTAVYNAAADKTLFEGKAREIYFDGARPLDNEGALKAWEIEFRVEIYGIIASGS